jgi:hypothetical protein
MKPVLNLFFLLFSFNLLAQDYVAEWTSLGHPIYEVQQSVDNINWKTIGTVAGLNVETTYQYPVSQSGYFYRVKTDSKSSNAIFLEPEILPVRIISVSIKANTLTWNVGSEDNVDYYLIESSTDGINFKEISKVKALGSNVYKISLK